MSNFPVGSPQEVPPCRTDSQEISTDPPILEGFVRRNELAKQLGVSPRTIDRWEVLRKGPPRIVIGRLVLYRLDAVKEWLQKRETQSQISVSSKRRYL